MTAHHAASGSVSGLPAPARERVRRLVARGASLLLSQPGEVHYSEGPDRWSAIASRKLILQPGRVFPFSGDCSSTATWLLWNGLAHHYGQGDHVNGERWQAGYTGTMAQHGRLVHDTRQIKVGDLVLYGQAPVFAHVAVALGGGMVFSHGSEAGPFKLSIDYRPDRGEVRRYI